MKPIDMIFILSISALVLAFSIESKDDKLYDAYLAGQPKAVEIYEKREAEQLQAKEKRQAFWSNVVQDFPITRPLLEDEKARGAALGIPVILIFIFAMYLLFQQTKNSR